ncbi:IS1634 family transposase [Brachybacterium sp.]|uniref:IS1634 family transposase n=1 Tax=Brachybacterium sp. TaxID=1891286 RepID=UPI0026486204|nr:IS1634 family transposase [Brachybacterium sp.]
MEAGRAKIHAGQGELALNIPAESDPAAVVDSSASRLLIEITRAWEALGFDGLDDKAFFQLVAARLIEPTSMLDSSRVLDDIGIRPVHRSTMKRCLARIQQRDYRGQIATKCFNHAWTSGDVSLVLYDVTTLYLEAEKEDALRKVGFSKERRVDPQIVVGLLVDRNGFPLEIGCYEGNKAETHTIVPIMKQFQARHGLADMAVVADAGMPHPDALIHTAGGPGSDPDSRPQHGPARALQHPLRDAPRSTWATVGRPPRAATFYSVI